MRKSRSLAASMAAAACAGVSGNGGTEMYGEITTGVETGRTTFGR